MPEEIEQINNDIPPIHQWTHDGTDVLLIKCLNRDGTSHGGFLYSESGETISIPDSRRDTECGGGIHGWAWGMGMDGKDPDACAEWLVIAAKPENVIDLGNKVKVVVGDDGALPLVVKRGLQQADAFAHVLPGQIAWIAGRSRASASQAGYLVSRQ
jgi:hypothetical protein